MKEIYHTCKKHIGVCCYDGKVTGGEYTDAAFSCACSYICPLLGKTKDLQDEMSCGEKMKRLHATQVIWQLVPRLVVCQPPTVSAAAVLPTNEKVE